ncbi:hypothetical protein IDJ77_23750 [Mucilaginibacter sp. ZT4R22]|uniref:DUF5808 domain-containing protein n=2 Tax=Mucilaginibacter pankratovii TaxID=2772110 RepID=A0ABR7WX26_9SPHI|nr:hypothetical protein [Mucilaginibacter pankratovii]
MNELEKKDASHWIWGLIYYNPADPKLVVPKRFGWGWTFNFAHKGSWIFILMVVGIIIAIKMLVR